MPVLSLLVVDKKLPVVGRSWLFFLLRELGTLALRLRVERIIEREVTGGEVRQQSLILVTHDDVAE